MANKIQIKRGSGSSVLSYGELGFNKDSNLLYIGREDGQNQVIGGEHVLGGRNLLSYLPLSSLPFGTGDNSGAETTGELSYDSGSNSLHIINTNSNTRFWLWTNHPVLVGETYTVSCWVASAEIDSERGEEYQFQIGLISETETTVWIDKNAGTLRYFSQPDPAKTDRVWKVIYQTFTVPTGTIKTSIAFRTGFDHETYTNNFFVKNFKIERSHTYTDWSPAPEDIVLRGMPTTANLTIQKSDPYLFLDNTDTNQKLGLHWHKNTENTNTFGIYDQANSKHLMSIKQDGTVTLYKALPITSGGTDSSTAEGARANLGAAAAWTENFTPAGARNNTLTNLLMVNLDSQTWNTCDYPCWVGTEGGTLINCPVDGVFYAYREVRKITDRQVMVTLTEAYPRPGRIWTRTYDKNYQEWLPQEGWACNETIHYGANAPTEILKGSIWLKPI